VISVRKFSFLSAALGCFITSQAHALSWDIPVPEIRGPNWDQDINFHLEGDEAMTATSEETMTFVCTHLIANGGKDGAFACAKFREKAAEIRSKASAKGAWVKMTIRNGSRLHIFETGPL
jgi:hypothetical protein